MHFFAYTSAQSEAEKTHCIALAEVDLAAKAGSRVCVVLEPVVWLSFHAQFYASAFTSNPYAPLSAGEIVTTNAFAVAASVVT